MADIHALIALYHSGQVGKAWAGVKTALKTQPNNPDLLNLAGVLAQAKKRRKDAIGYLTACIKLRPPTSDPYRTLALELLPTNSAQALKVAQLACTRFAQDAHCWSVLAAVLHDRQAAHDAVQAAEKAVSLAPDDANLCNQACALLLELGMADRALDHGRRAAQLAPHSAVFAHNYGTCLVLRGHTDAAIKAFETALAQDGSYSPAMVSLIALRLAQNDLTRAEDLCRQVLSIAPDHGYSWLKLAELRPSAQAPDLLAKLRAQAPAARRQGDNAAYLDLAEAQLLRACAKMEQASEATQRANRRLAASRPCDPQTERAKGNHARALWQSRDWAAHLAMPPCAFTPIFIVGVMRSGTTLLERMLGQHPDATGVGELGFLDDLFASSFKTGAQITADDLRAVHGQYVDHFAAQNAAHAANPRIMIDKMPINMRYAGFLHALFPGARVIYLRRHPNDIATSIFETVFDSEAHAFSYSEEGIDAHLQDHLRQVAFWDRQRVPMMTVDYEHLVHDPAAQIRAVAEYCDMALVQDMLHPDANAAAIRTASALQARAPISHSSVGRWTRSPALLPALYANWAQGWPEAHDDAV